MALIHCRFFSKSLFMNTDITVIIPTFSSSNLQGGPDAGYMKPGKKCKVLYLLHGIYGDCSNWERYTRIEQYADDHGLAVVMPSAENSFYTDMAHGQRYYTYICEELPAFAEMMFPISDRREDTFIAGLSMGGYGAYKLALSRPEKFSCAASLSGALDIKALYLEAQRQGNMPFSISDIWESADSIAETGSDLLVLLQQLKEQGKDIPRLYQACGTEDPMYALNTAVRDRIRGMGVDLTFYEEHGAHEWSFWDRTIAKVIDWLPLQEG